MTHVADQLLHHQLGAAVRIDSDDSDQSEASAATEVAGGNQRSAFNANIINK